MVSFLGVQHSDSDCEKLRAIGKGTTGFSRVLELRSFVEGINEDAMLLGSLWHFFWLFSSSSLLLLVLAVHVTLTFKSFSHVSPFVILHTDRPDNFNLFSVGIEFAHFPSIIRLMILPIARYIFCSLTEVSNSPQ